jgi:perosamine synthetase
MMKIPFYKPSLTSAEIEEVVETLRSGWLTTGVKTKQFESDFASYIGQAHAVAVNSCTAALHLALEALGVQSGDGVLVPTMTFAATAEVVRYLGGQPLLVDCHESDFNLDVADAERRLETALSKGQPVTAIMPVHYGGQIGDVEAYRRLAGKYGLKIVEDAAHCCPAYFLKRTSDETPSEPPPSWRRSSTGEFPQASVRPEQGELDSSSWRPVGSSADISCFSFYANKCITTGEGGMACTQNADYADRMRIMSLHGISRDAWKRFTGEGSWYYEILAPGYKYNLTDIASALGIHQLRRAGELHAQRASVARIYQEKLQDIEELVLPEVQPDRVHSWHLFVIRLRLERLTINRAQFIDALKAAGIGTSVHYTPLHLHPYYREKYGYRPEDLPCMAAAYPRIITLPLYPDMEPGEVEYVCRTIREIVTRHLISRQACR